MKRIVTVALLLCTALASGCGSGSNPITGKNDGDSSADAQAGQFLSPATFTPDDKQTVLTSAEVVRSLNGDKTFYNEAPASSTSSSTTAEDEKCMLKADQLTSTKNELSIYMELDSSGCPADQQPVKTTGTTTSSMKMRVYAYIACSDTDLSAYNGKSAWDFVQSNSDLNCSKDKNTRILSNAEVTFDIKSDTASLTSRSLSGMMAADGKPCPRQFDGTTFKTDGCTEFSKSVSSSTFSPTTGGNPTTSSKSTLTLETYSGISGEPGKRYFSSGKFDVTFNAWKGTVNYTGSATAPTYSITDGKQTMSGTYTGPTTSSVNGDVDEMGAEQQVPDIHFFGPAVTRQWRSFVGSH